MAKVFDDYEQRDDDEFEERRPASPSLVAAARKRCGMPGTILIIFGLVGMIVEVVALGIAWSRPYFAYDQIINFYEGMPAGPERDKAIAQMKLQKEQMRGDNPLNVGGSVVGLILNFFMLVGGAKMRGLSGYSVALTGAICGLIPIGGCFCCAMPVGLWAVIVLANADVKKAFTMASRSEP